MVEAVLMIAMSPRSLSFLIRPAGALDSITSEYYRRNVIPLFDLGYRHIIIDMEKTETMGSSGLGLLVALYKHTSSQEGSIRIINCCRNVMNLLQRTKLDSITRMRHLAVQKPER
ncbi:STAS domain-containing protein [Candidatus Sumerlaeota bacterium]|nr:STAS domain-containing protein [Candidatus Sumerlaeota bacterium]